MKPIRINLADDIYLSTGGIYSVTFKEYGNDEYTRQVKVFATNSLEAESKVRRSGLVIICAENPGCVISSERIEDGILA